MNIDKCKELRKNPTKNPITKRNIKADGPTYLKLAKECEGLKSSPKKQKERVREKKSEPKIKILRSPRAEVASPSKIFKKPRMRFLKQVSKKRSPPAPSRKLLTPKIHRFHVSILTGTSYQDFSGIFSRGNRLRAESFISKVKDPEIQNLMRYTIPPSSILSMDNGNDGAQKNINIDSFHIISLLEQIIPEYSKPLSLLQTFKNDKLSSDLAAHLKRQVEIKVYEGKHLWQDLTRANIYLGSCFRQICGNVEFHLFHGIQISWAIALLISLNSIVIMITNLSFDVSELLRNLSFMKYELSVGVVEEIMEGKEYKLICVYSVNK